MARLDEEFIPDNVEDVDFSPLPDGNYAVTISTVDVKQTKAGTGTYFKIGYVCENNGRKIFDMINYKNQSEVAQNIGRSQLKKLCDAVNVRTLRDTDELIGKRLVVTVVVEDGGTYTDQYGETKKGKASNKVTNYSPYTGAQASSTASAPVEKKNPFAK